MASPGNRHCVGCIGILMFPMLYTAVDAQCNITHSTFLTVHCLIYLASYSCSPCRKAQSLLTSYQTYWSSTNCSTGSVIFLVQLALRLPSVL